MGEKLERKATRLNEYDYSQNGGYFVTICTRERRKLFCEIRNCYKCEYGMLPEICRGDPCGRPRVQLSELGEICEHAMTFICEKYGITIDKYAIMPNHIHMIIVIDRDKIAERATARVAPTLGLIVGGFKSIVSVKVRHLDQKIWQRSFHDHIIRNRLDYERVWKYIDENPAKWELDEYYCN